MTRRFDRVKIDGEHAGTVVQDGCQKSLVATARSDGESGWEQDWYDNDRLTVIARRQSKKS